MERWDLVGGQGGDGSGWSLEWWLNVVAAISGGSDEEDRDSWLDGPLCELLLGCDSRGDSRLLQKIGGVCLWRL